MKPPVAQELRRKRLTEARTESESSELVFYQGGYRHFPVVHVPIDLPVYRASNGRLAVMKAEYVKTHSVDPKFFENGEQSPEVQSALFEMLIEVAKSPDAPIYQELRNIRIQAQRLLLTSDGIVVDGNRRLASMRALYEADPETFGQFSTVEAIVLPEDASNVDIELIEANRQLAPDTKLAYGWIDRRLKLRYHRYALDLSPKVIRETYRLTSEKQLYSELEELELAETYLDDYLGMPRNYKLIERAEEFFAGLRNQLAEKHDDKMKRIWQLIGFAMIKEAETQAITARDYHPFVPPKFGYMPSPVLEHYGEQKDLWDYSPDLGSGKFLNESKIECLIADLNQPESSKEIAGSIIRIFGQVLVKHEENPHPIFVVNQIRHINNVLSQIDLRTYNESQRREFRGQLAELEFHLRNFLKGDNQTSKHIFALPAPPTIFGPAVERVVSWFAAIRNLLRKR